MNESINQSINQTITEPTAIFGYTAPFTNSPAIDIFLITLVVVLFTTLIHKYMTDQVRIKALKAEMKELQKKMRETMAKDPKKAQAMQQDIMKKNMENMKHMMNPKIMLVTMVPLLVVFTFIGKIYGPFGEAVLDFGLGSWFFGHPWGWLGTYIFFSIINSIILKKLLDVA